MKYVKKSAIIEVHQWTLPQSWPRNYPAMDTREQFKGIVKLVDAGVAMVKTGLGRDAVVEDGDYLLPDGLGYLPVKKKEFERDYDLVAVGRPELISNDEGTATKAV